MVDSISYSANCKVHGLVTDCYRYKNRTRCRLCHKEKNKKWDDAHREQKRAYNRFYQMTYPERARASQEKLQRQNRLDAIAAYGGKCECCGERMIQFMTIDHINNDGHKHRKEDRTANDMFTWVKKNGYPLDGFQLLCFNCNMGKKINGGVCPHESFLRLVGEGKE